MFLPFIAFKLSQNRPWFALTEREVGLQTALGPLSGYQAKDSVHCYQCTDVGQLHNVYTEKLNILLSYLVNVKYIQ